MKDVRDAKGLAGGQGCRVAAAQPKCVAGVCRLRSFSPASGQCTSSTTPTRGFRIHLRRPRTCRYLAPRVPNIACDSLLQLVRLILVDAKWKEEVACRGPRYCRRERTIPGKTRKTWRATGNSAGGISASRRSPLGAACGRRGGHKWGDMSLGEVTILGAMPLWALAPRLGGTASISRDGHQRSSALALTLVSFSSSYPNATLSGAPRTDQLASSVQQFQALRIH